MKLKEILNKIWKYIKIAAKKVWYYTKIVAKKTYEIARVVLKKAYYFLKLGAKKGYAFSVTVFHKTKNKYKSLSSEKKKKVNMIAACSFAGIIIVSVLTGILLGGKPNNNNSSLVFGTPIVENVSQVNTGGDVITINDEESLIDGLKITVPSNTYSMPLDFVVKTQPIVEHNFGEHFNPITPLIEINNGHDFANKVMQVEIPITLAGGKIAMGFYYYEEDKTLEAIPTLALTSEKIVLGVKHFSKIIVSDISIETMQSLTQVATGGLNTGFTPALDDWHYTNYGSYLASGGHCAGQSLTMSWYYSEKFQKENMPRLYGQFDNNEQTDTPNFWLDDNHAYRFSSVVQNAIDWSANEWLDFINYSTANPKQVFYAFAYAIQVTKSPQLMAIFPSDFGMGHAIVAYKVEGNKIYVADPNFPSQTDRYVEYDPTIEQFKPYSSGANATDISSNGTTAYTNIVYVAKTALIDFNFISENFKKLMDGTVGDNEFPKSKIEVMTKHDKVTYTNMEWQTVSNEVNLGQAYLDSLPNDLVHKGFIRITPSVNNLAYSIYYGNSEQPVLAPYFYTMNGSLYYEVDLVSGENDFAFLIEYENTGNYYYVNFVRLKINYLQSVTNSIISFESNGGSEVAPIEQEVGSVVIAPTVPSKLGYTFAGWYEEMQLMNAYSFATMPNANITLYAKWIPDNLLSNIAGKYFLYTIDNNKNLGTIEYHCYEVFADGSYTETLKLIANDNLTTDSGTWTLTQDRLVFSNGVGTYEVTADGQFLYDLPTEQSIFVYKKAVTINTFVTITFDSNGGSAVAPITQNANSSVTAPSAPTKANYYFVGWFINDELTTPYVFSVMPNKDITLYAKWTKTAPTTVNIACTYHSNYSYRPDLYTQQYNIGDAFPYEYLEGWRQDKSGHKFAGYYIDAACTILLTYSTVPNHDVFVYIKWTPLTEAEMLVRYNQKNLREDLDYNYIIFYANRTFIQYYKYKNSESQYQSPGTWNFIETENVISFYANYESSSFPVNFVIYEDRLYTSNGEWIKAQQ
jgi:uncharacterized repeat protein (TIGR02543 family)